MLINFTNHPSKNWSEKQIHKALEYGSIVDMPFPEVPAAADEREIAHLAAACAGKIIEKKPAAVLCQGEFTLAYQLITLLKAQGIPVLAACSERNVHADGNKKQVVFEFQKFRRY